ncbi:hypothetical protein PHYC_02973 [Phycisphaerales bacterium]|nr:hypothetical protein PHYC_02973 [Phycisphaerales bacterium]
MQALHLIRRVFRCVSLDEAAVDHALGSAIVDFEDAIQAAAAAQCGAQHIVTRDQAGFDGSSVPAVTPEELLAIL